MPSKNLTIHSCCTILLIDISPKSIILPLFYNTTGMRKIYSRFHTLLSSSRDRFESLIASQSQGQSIYLAIGPCPLIPIHHGIGSFTRFQIKRHDSRRLRSLITQYRCTEDFIGTSSTVHDLHHHAHHDIQQQNIVTM